MYRIYLRISQEILDKIWPKFCQFDLYAGHTFFVQKGSFINYLSDLRFKYLGSLKTTYNFEFWTIFETYFFNSTYTRIDLVYTVILGS
jgi:hypothetical protein